MEARRLGRLATPSVPPRSSSLLHSLSLSPSSSECPDSTHPSGSPTPDGREDNASGSQYLGTIPTRAVLPAYSGNPPVRAAQELSPSPRYPTSYPPTSPLSHDNRTRLSDITPPSQQRSRESDSTFVPAPYEPSTTSPHADLTDPDSDTSTCPPASPIPSMSNRGYPLPPEPYHYPPHQIPARRHHLGYDEPQRPLIDYVTNEWQNKPSYRDSSFDSQDSYSNFVHEKAFELATPELPAWLKRLQSIQIPRRVRRALIIWGIFLFGFWFYFLVWVLPAWEHEKLLDDSEFRMTHRGANFGVNMRPFFSDMVHMRTLDPTLLPRVGAEQRRLVFVGDVHGCRDELEQLLTKVDFNKETDHLIFTGDLIAKGPDSSGAVELAMDIKASCVRGNWEDRTLLAHNALKSKVHPLPGPSEDPHTKDDYLDEVSFNHGDYKDRALAKLLSKKQIGWLQDCPVILKIGRIDNFNGGGEIVVSHAGLVPGVNLENQDPYQAMNMRTIDLETRVPSEERWGEPWEKLWNHHQAHIKTDLNRSTVIYGHDAKIGLNIQKYSKGLDSGCLRGGALTALILDFEGRQKVVSVNCNNYKE